MRDVILFDLDGTLTDPGIGITNSVAYALRKFGIDVEDRKTLYSFIGPPLYDKFREEFALSHDDANLAIKYYREYFVPEGMFENTIYDGIPELLDRLKKNGKTLVVATSKPEEFALKILEHFDLRKYFDAVFGATLDEKRNTKDAVIAFALESLSLSPDSTVMVGDRKYDVEGAHKNNLLAIGVLYGYGSREEMTEANADFIAENISALEKILL